MAFTCQSQAVGDQTPLIGSRGARFSSSPYAKVSWVGRPRNIVSGDLQPQSAAVTVWKGESFARDGWILLASFT